MLLAAPRSCNALLAVGGCLSKEPTLEFSIVFNYFFNRAACPMHAQDPPHGCDALLAGWLAVAAPQVSPTYAQEISGHPAIAAHHSKFYGITNGIDPDIWDPSEDRSLPR